VFFSSFFSPLSSFSHLLPQEIKAFRFRTISPGTVTSIVFRDETTSPPKSQSIKGDQLWVNSFPEGACVYLIPGPVDDYTTGDDLMKDEYYVGTAPLLITVNPGLYELVMVVPVSEIESAGFDVLSADEPLDRFEFDGNNPHGMTYDNGEPDLFYKIYTLKKLAGEYEALVTILLPVPEDELEHTVPYLYPSLNMVGFLPKRYNVDEQ
jgi:hypothetical protein